MVRALSTLMVVVGLVNPALAQDDDTGETPTVEQTASATTEPPPVQTAQAGSARGSFEPTESELAQYQLPGGQRDLIGGGDPSGAFVASGVSMFAASAADILTTEWGLSQGLVEGNPLVTQRGVRIATHVAGPLAVYWATEKLRRSGRGKLAWALRLSITAAYAFASVHNARIIHQTTGVPQF